MVDNADQRELAVVIPAFNESKNVYRCIKEVEKTMGNPISDYEIIIMDNASTDDTYIQSLRGVVENARVKVFRCEEHGKGAALKHSFNFTNSKLVTFIDADMDLHPKQIPLFIKYMKEHNADVVIGSKRHPQSKVRYPLTRKFLSNIYYIFVRVLFGLPVRDTQTGLKLFKYKVLKKILPKVLVKKYAFDLELLVNAKHNKFKIVEAPIDLKFRRYSSRISIRAIWKMFVDTAAIFYRLRVMKYYDNT